MPRYLPPQSSLRQLKNQAKDLCKAYQAHDPEALRRFRETHPQHHGSSDSRLLEAGLTLQDAQLVVAREYGFDSWPKLAAAAGDPTARPRSGTEIIGGGQAAQRILAEMERAASSEVAILIAGEKGVGKRLAARLIHAMSRRSAGPLVQMTCDAENGVLCESDLFGYEPGAFTGAKTTQEGHLQMANGGTLVLDEIGSLSSSAQAKLQRFIESGGYRRLGGSQDLSADVRLIGTTSRDLREMVNSGSLREDLYYQIAVLGIELPPLRDRAEDIPALAEYFAVKMGHRDAPRFSPEALALLATHSWPGNVRELRNTVERAVAASSGGAVSPEVIRLQSPASAPRD